MKLDKITLPASLVCATLLALQGCSDSDDDPVAAPVTAPDSGLPSAPAPNDGTAGLPSAPAPGDQAASAWSRSRPRDSSRPSTAITSNRPGEVARPVRAARSGCAT